MSRGFLCLILYWTNVSLFRGKPNWKLWINLSSPGSRTECIHFDIHSQNVSILTWGRVCQLVWPWRLHLTGRRSLYPKCDARVWVCLFVRLPAWSLNGISVGVQAALLWQRFVLPSIYLVVYTLLFVSDCPWLLFWNSQIYSYSTTHSCLWLCLQGTQVYEVYIVRNVFDGTCVRCIWICTVPVPFINRRLQVLG